MEVEIRGRSEEEVTRLGFDISMNPIPQDECTSYGSQACPHKTQKESGHSVRMVKVLYLWLVGSMQVC